MTTKREFLAKDCDTVIRTDIGNEEVGLTIFGSGDRFYCGTDTYNFSFDASPAQIEKAWREAAKKWEKLIEVITRCHDANEAMFAKHYDEAVGRQETKDAD